MLITFLSEMYFIGLMMLLTLVLTVAATFIFIRQYRREKKNPPIVSDPKLKKDKEYVSK